MVHEKINMLRNEICVSNPEKTADLVANICEDIIFTVEGRGTKHHYAKGPE